MPLHLLGKKSWNVYNADNIARVQRDEAAAAAEEHAAEQRMQDADAARRLAILRGETPPPLPEEEQPADPSDKKYLRRERGRDGAWLGGPRKRKRAGEDDTDFEMRVARERAEEGGRVRAELGAGGQEEKGGVDVDVDIVDGRGHIDLVGAVPEDPGEKKQEGKARGVAGRDTTGALKGEFADTPWYADAKRRRITPTVSSTALVPVVAAERGMEAPTTNVWGRDDPKRRGRETARLDASDPLAAMKSGAKKVRDMAKERRRDAEERARELEELRKEDRRREGRRRGRDHAGEGRDSGGDADELRRHSHRSGRSGRRHQSGERRESSHGHGHREDRRRHREREHSREPEKDRHHRHHRRDRERSRERDRSSRSRRYDDGDDRHGHRERDDRRR
ncbi:hypothetical protein KVR01_007397 [Diaporthe batatas]|uniref:uncharacterized protein n=1 Tax=Diaporthe batatas TaxID=748121 RepID=UPI001D04E563|nr:uncharacterized protein KVR01_007397 [Diaporthe batatas]KAG8162919.1 hypothetical protein KVR01_007397 [Diaporthe batatas]